MDLKKILKSPIYITPNFPVVKTKNYKFTLLGMITGLVVYSLVLFLLSIALFAFTPLKKMVFFIENQELEEQVERVKELESKIVFLTHELESISSENKRLRYAVILATTDSLDSNSAIYDSLREEKYKNLNIEGNILTAFRGFIDLIFREKSENDEIYFLRPSSGYIIKHYDPQKGHLGIDFGIKSGSPVYAASSGIVIFSDYVSDEGNMIMIQHKNDFITVYKHCSVLMKKTREKVIQGELVALSGSSGKASTGPHLHFEIWKNGNAVNPKNLIINK
ncbi:MAG: M23 family metallopeptidase [Ignavibacteriae bacterium]|nr:M23 family metallopeptidase [Ignavibacteriota bacterium]